jgi:intracellular sulfur oxidation DsrE/DsrF family protein
MSELSECDEIRLNALLDGELDGDERAELLERMAVEPALREAYWQLAVTRDLVAHAWDEREPAEAPEPASAMPPRRLKPALAAAAAVLLAVGFLAGRTIVPSPSAGDVGLVSAEQTEDRKVVVHVMDADPEHQRAALDRVNELLAAGNERVELVAHSEGLDLVRAGYSAEAGRIQSLLADNPDLQVYACGNTIARLQRNGEQVELLEGTRRASSAVDLIVDRLRNGWRYIKA